MRRLRLPALVLIVGTVFAAGAPALAAGATTPAPAGVRGTLQHISALGPNEVWAAGQIHAKTGKWKHVMYHRGSSWSRVTGLPGFEGSNGFYGVEAVNPHDVWALAEAGYGRPFAVHWDGAGWTKTPLPSADRRSVYRGIDALGPHDIWAVGSRVVVNPSTGARYYHPLAAHYDGSSWQSVDVPGLDDAGLTGISMASDDDGWATLTNVEDPGHKWQLLHWDGSTWSLVDGPAGSVAAEVHVTTIDDVSPTDAWAGTDTARVLHWDGSSWTAVPFASTSYLDEVAASGPDDVWAAGKECPRQCRPALEHWDGTSWTSYPAPTGQGLYDVSAIAVDSPTDAWATATYAKAPNIRHTALLHWDGTSWSVT